MIGDIFNTIFLNPVINLLVLILNGLQIIHLPGVLGFAIIILTILIRLLVWPIMASQLKAAKKMADLKPRLDEIKRKHKDDKQAFAKAQMELYKEHGVNPASGCLPALLQIPIFIALYQTILAFISSDGLDRINQALYLPSWHLNQLPPLDFFGLNLATKPAQFPEFGFFLLLIPIATALLQFIQSKMMVASPIKGYPGDLPKEKKEKENIDESLSAVQSQMSFLMPLMVGYFAYQFPIGLALYWNTFTVLGIAQQYLISGWGSLASVLNIFKKH